MLSSLFTILCFPHVGAAFAMFISSLFNDARENAWVKSLVAASLCQIGHATKANGGTTIQSWPQKEELRGESGGLRAAVRTPVEPIRPLGLDGVE